MQHIGTRPLETERLILRRYTAEEFASSWCSTQNNREQDQYDGADFDAFLVAFVQFVGV